MVPSACSSCLVSGVHNSGDDDSGGTNLGDDGGVVDSSGIDGVLE